MIKNRRTILQKKDLNNNINKKITAQGRITKRRIISKSLSFILLKTHLGEIQCALSGLKCPPTGSIVKIVGRLNSDPEINSGLSGFEIVTEKITILFLETNSRTIKNNIKSRGENRHIDLRNEEVSLIFKAKAEALRVTREFLNELGFIEVYSSKIIGKSTEGPLAAFSINYFGNEAFLSISNILLHTEIITGDMPKIFEIGPCFRGTKSKTNHHVNEFTVLDFAASFMTPKEFMTITENLITTIIKKIALIDEKLKKPLDQLLSDGFEVINYNDAINLTSNCGNNNIDYPELSYENMKKFFKSFTWITNFPEKDRPFYVKSRKVGKENLCYNFQLWHPAIGNLMDGSERVTQPEEARKKIAKKNLDLKNFDKYIEVLESGAPPHVGTGLSFDRFIQLILGLNNIREVILFPRDEKTIPK